MRLCFTSYVTGKQNFLHSSLKYINETVIYFVARFSAEKHFRILKTESLSVAAKKKWNWKSKNCVLIYLWAITLMIYRFHDNASIYNTMFRIEFVPFVDPKVWRNQKLIPPEQWRRKLLLRSREIPTNPMGCKYFSVTDATAGGKQSNPRCGYRLVCMLITICEGSLMWPRIIREPTQ